MQGAPQILIGNVRHPLIRFLSYIRVRRLPLRFVQHSRTGSVLPMTMWVEVLPNKLILVSLIKAISKSRGSIPRRKQCLYKYRSQYGNSRVGNWGG